MKKLHSLLFFVLLIHSSKAQISSIFTNEFSDTIQTRVGITGDYGLDANALTGKFVSKFYKGGYIDSDLKSEVLNRTKNVNRIGADLNAGVFVAIKLDSLFHKKNFSFFFSLRDREHFDARYSEDFFKVGFYGNSAYAGKTADFNNFNLNFIRYQQLQIGLFSSKLDSAARWGIGVSFLKGEQFASIFAKKAELYTSEDGQYIDFNTGLEVAQSDTTNKGLGAFNGYGASIDLYFEAPFKTRLGNSKLKLSVSDLGIIRFNSQSLYLNQDSLFHYKGFTVNSIYDLQDSTFGNTNSDSIVNRIAPFKKKSVNVTLPATLNLSFETQFSKYFLLSEGLRYVFSANYKLLTYVKASFYLKKDFILSATAGYGGYGNFNYGIGVFANFGKGYMLYAGSNNIEGFIAPSKTCGQGAYMSIVKQF